MNTDELKSLVLGLHETSNALNAPIDDIELALKKLNLGITAEVEFAPTMFLGYERINMGNVKWGLTISMEVEKEDENVTTWWPMRDAPRVYRMQAIDAIPALIVKLTEETKVMIERVKAATVKAEAMAAIFTAAGQEIGKR